MIFKISVGKCDYRDFCRPMDLSERRLQCLEVVPSRISILN